MPDAAILGQLDPIANGITTWGWDLAQASIAYRYVVGVIVTAIVAPFAIAGGASGRRIGWAALALLAGTWGQILLFSDLIVPGVLLFVFAAAAAFVFGLANPLRASAPPPVLGIEIAAVVALTMLALVVRLYALDQLPAFVDIEPALAFFESLSRHGLGHYIAYNRVEDDGFAQMLARARYSTSPVPRWSASVSPASSAAPRQCRSATRWCAVSPASSRRASPPSCCSPHRSN
jgi:hypothetical protein